MISRMSERSHRTIYGSTGTLGGVAVGHGEGVENTDLANMRRVGLVIFAVTILGAFVLAESIEGFIGFAVVLAVAASPFFVWTRSGTTQLPILPASILFYLPSYANAGLSGNVGNYTRQEVLVGELTVALFLCAAVLAWFVMASRKPLRIVERDHGLAMDARLRQVMLAALFIGMVFDVGAQGGWWGWMGTAYGTFRTCAGSATLAGCFLYGAVLGMRRFSSTERATGGVLVSAILMIETSSLLLYAAILNFIAVCLGYFLVAKKIPWTAVVVGLVIAMTLQAAKSQMRAEHWNYGSQSVSLSDIPSLMTEWFDAGVGNLLNGGQTNQQSLADRASLLPNLLLVQKSSPQPVPYLDGQTYMNFWKMVVPRFLAPDKIISQSNLALLSVHYRLQTIDQTTTTTISWGLVSEAYANFGYMGVVLAGLAFGGLAGWLTSLTVGAPTISLRGFIGLASMIVLIQSVAYDFSYMLLNLIQSIVAMCLLFAAIDIFTRRGRNA